MKLTSGAPEWLAAFTAAERPDLWALARDERLFGSLWPEYNHHGNDTGNRCPWSEGRRLPFDPWLRVHARLGGRILRPEPRSLRITAPVQEWQRWTEMLFPEDGNYVFPGGLAPLSVEGDIGHYWEPNVWVLHDVCSPVIP